MPAANNVKIYDVNKIVNSKKRMTHSEQLNHILELKSSLLDRLKMVYEGAIIQNHKNMDYHQFLIKHGMKESEVHIPINMPRDSYAGSSIDEENDDGLIVREPKCTSQRIL